MYFRTYREVIEDFEENVKPEVVELNGDDDEMAINEAWNNWTDGLRTAGDISERAYDEWCYEPALIASEDNGFIIMCDGKEIAQAIDEEEAEYLVYEFSDGFRCDDYDGDIYYEVATCSCKRL